MYIEAKIEKLLDLKKAIEIGPIAPLIEHAGSTMAHLNSQVHWPSDRSRVAAGN